MCKSLKDVLAEPQSTPPCALCGCIRQLIPRRQWRRPAVAATASHSALHVARIEEWLAKVPAVATFCWCCARRFVPVPPSRVDRRVHDLAVAELFFAAFGHPTLRGREDWRPATRRAVGCEPCAVSQNADAAAVLYGALPGEGPRPLYPRRRETARGWRRWLKVRKRARRRARRRSRRMGALAAISWLFARAEHGQGGLVRAEARMGAR